MLRSWRITASATLNHRAFHLATEQGFDTNAYQAGIDNGQINPFPIPQFGMLGGLSSNMSRSLSDTGTLFAFASGDLLRLPSGPVGTVLRLQWQADRASSRTIGVSGNISRRLHRDEGLAQLSFNIPLLGGSQKSHLGDVALELAGTLRHVSGTGSLHDYTAAIDWQPSTALSFRAAIDEQQTAPPSNLLTDPVVITEGVRYYDFVRQEMVLVRQITGGNPNLAAETTWTKTLSATYLPFGGPDFAIDVDYSSVVDRDGDTSLPPLTAQVQAAFPDRFQRDSSGMLVTVDDRPVTIARIAYGQIQWGFNFTHTFRQRLPRSEARGPNSHVGTDVKDVLAPGLRVNAYATHVWTLTSTQLIRSGLPVVDILRGGASANASALYRHTLRFGGSVAYKGMGLQVDGQMLGGRSISAGSATAPGSIRYAPRTEVNVRIFANLDTLLPRSALAHGARLSIEVKNAFDSKQEVTDQSGHTPAGLQPYLIDPLGRQISLTLRKAL